MDKEQRLELAKKAGLIHKKIRKEIHEWIKPGLKMIDIANKIESRIQELTFFDINDPIKAGIAFPTGLSLNECAAHWTPNPNDKTILNKKDVCKVDYGVQINGVIIDSAFTISFDPIYDNLLEASRTSTEIALKMAGPDTILGEIGAAVQENMESYEIEINGKIHPIKSIKNLTGHQIEPYQIHAGKSVPNYNIDYPVRMLEGEYYAVETFSSSGTGSTLEGSECSHYMIDYNSDYNNFSLAFKDRKCFDSIHQKFFTLAFCNRWLNFYDIPKYNKILKNLCSTRVIKKYPPLYDVKGSFTAQFEHSILITDKGNIILSDL